MQYRWQAIAFGAFAGMNNGWDAFVVNMAIMLVVILLVDQFKQLAQGDTACE